MNSDTTRRDMLRMTGQGALAAAAFAWLTSKPVLAEPPKAIGADGKPWPGFPRQDQKLVAEIVGASHFDEARVQALVKSYPELVNAWWDWGFGDWESPLGAASHTGQREIAEYLISQGARIDIFAAAMMGMTDVVRALVSAQPGIQRTLGPHGIPLLHHAKAGGERAAETVAYLEGLGDAGTRLMITPLSEGRSQSYLGEFGSSEHDLRMVCRQNKNSQLVVDIQCGESLSNNRAIQYLGNDEFCPSGVPSVRIRFVIEYEQATSVTIGGSVPELTLRRGARQ